MADDGVAYSQRKITASVVLFQLLKTGRLVVSYDTRKKTLVLKADRENYAGKWTENIYLANNNNNNNIDDNNHNNNITTTTTTTNVAENTNYDDDDALIRAELQDGGHEDKTDRARKYSSSISPQSSIGLYSVDGESVV